MMPILLTFLLAAQASAGPRYFYHGDGQLQVKGGVKNIERLTPRLVALLDYLQDQLTEGKGTIAVYSGYRPPEYNEKLRRQGKLAAKASLHMEGMAVDFGLSGVDSKKLWEFVRGLDCCGAGYYSGRMVHVDTGPKRFWDQTTSKVFTDISAANKQIYLTTEYDIYYTGEPAALRLVRITEYPLGVWEKVEVVDEKGKRLKKLKLGDGCRMITGRAEAQNFSLTLPRGLPKNRRLQIKISFCSKPSQSMPDFVLSNAFVIVPGR